MSYILCLIQRYPILYIQHFIGLGSVFHGNYPFICLRKKGFTWQSESVSFSSHTLCPLPVPVFLGFCDKHKMSVCHWEQDSGGHSTSLQPQRRTGGAWSSDTQGNRTVPGLSLNSVCNQKSEGSGQETQHRESKWFLPEQDCE